MKFWILGIMAALVLLASCAVRTPEQETAHDDRQYRKVLDSYWRDLKPGTSREEVQDYLRSRNTTFSYATGKTPYAFEDEVYLREEVRPWLCGSAYVLIVFVFDPPPGPHRLDETFAAKKDDTLTEIHVRKMVDCP
jgi:hypothetical protein